MGDRRFRTAWAAIVLVLLALVLAACGGGGGGGAQSAGSDVEPAGRGRGLAQSAGDEGGNLPSSGSSGEEFAAGSVTPESEALPEDFDRKIVKTAELGIRAEDVRDGAASAQRIAARFDGSVLSSQVDGSGDDSVYAELVISVPSGEFVGALDELRGLGEEVITDTVGGEDVTEEFVDLESRERNLVAAEQSLLGLYDRADSVGDALSVERELTNIRGQIEQMQGRIQYLEQNTASSQITLSIEPVPAPPPRAAAWSPADIAARAWEASLGVLQALATAAISAVVFGWWISPALVAGFVWWRRRTRDTGPTATGS